MSQFFLSEGSKYHRLNPQPWKSRLSCIRVWACCQDVAYLRGNKKNMIPFKDLRLVGVKLPL